MELKITKTYNITYSVECFENNEGGMYHACFASNIHSIEKAIAMLELAEVKEIGSNWIIVTNVETKVISSNG